MGSRDRPEQRCAESLTSLPGTANLDVIADSATSAVHVETPTRCRVVGYQTGVEAQQAEMWTEDLHSICVAIIIMLMTVCNELLVFMN